MPGRAFINRTHDQGVISDDAYTGSKGHYYLGPSRRRIGAGFGRRRAGEGHGYGDDPERCEVAPWNEELQTQCREEAGGINFNTTISGTITDVSDHEGVPDMMVVFKKRDCSGEEYHAFTDENGDYQIDLQRCEFWTMSFIKDGYAKDDGAGGCRDPLITYSETETWINAVRGEGRW